jgi:nucleotide-binding universal stress UspA family protein
LQKVKRILVATDFSTRSDRALRRAILLARALPATLDLVHAVDADQPEKLVRSQQRDATALLRVMTATMRKTDDVPCKAHVVLGEPFQAIADAAEEFDAELMVMGPYRRQILRDAFLGTTVERTIRRSRRPVIMANAVPAGTYTRVLVATDFSDCSAHAALVARDIGIFEHAQTVFLHAFDAPGQSMMLRAGKTMDQIKDHFSEAEQDAKNELSNFLDRIQFRPDDRLLQLTELSAAETIRQSAKMLQSDLILIGTQGRSAVGNLLLGSVAEEVLRNSAVDVLVVPQDKHASIPPAHAA